MRSISISKKSIRSYSALLLFSAIIVTFSALIHSTATTTRPPTNQQGSIISESTLPKSRGNPTPQSCSSCAEQGPQTIYAPLIQLSDFSGTEINLNCRSAHSVEVTPTFFTQNGESFAGEPFEMLSLEVRTINLKTLMPPAIRGRRDLGGMTLSYIGGMFEMWGQLRLMNVNHGNSVDVTFVLRRTGDQQSETRCGGCLRME